MVCFILFFIPRNVYVPKLVDSTRENIKFWLWAVFYWLSKWSANNRIMFNLFYTASLVFIFLREGCKTSQMMKDETEKPKWILPYLPQVKFQHSQPLERISGARVTAWQLAWLLKKKRKKKGMCQVELPMLSMASFNILMCFITTVWAR